MKSILHLLPFLLHTTLRGRIPSNYSSHIRMKVKSDGGIQLPELIKYEVCLSPGCMADGAKATLERLQALAPPNVIVQPGRCSSACGHGPVVLENPPENDENSGKTTLNTKKRKSVQVQHRRVKGAKIMDLLSYVHKERTDPPIDKYSNDMTETPPAVVRGYDLVLEADVAFAKKDYETAVCLYREAIQVSFSAAIGLQRLRERVQPSIFSATKTQEPVGLEWLVRARRNEAKGKLELGLVEDAMLAAQAACNLSRNTSSEAFQILAEIYQRKGEARGELQALQTMFALPVKEDQLTHPLKNLRRELGFRLASLERQIGQM
jgi:tetratricopeptide (TPR) repeat protein